MRRFLLVCVVTACGGGGEGLEVQESSCQANRFHYVHDLDLGETAGGEGDLSADGLSFINAGFTTGDGPPENGVLEIFKSGGSGPTTIVHVEFEDLLANGATVDARGYVRLDEQGVHAGNCETAAFTGRISDFGDGWKFTLVDLHASPYCSGAAIGGSFAGCTRSP
jgi:hypothetical protein